MSANLVVSSNFSRLVTDASLWPPTTSTATRDTSVPFLGLDALKQVYGFTGNDNYCTGTISGLTSALTYTFSAYYYCAVFNGSPTGSRLLFVIGGGNPLNATNTAATSGWQRVSVTTTGATSYQIRLYGCNGTMYWTNIQVELGSSPSNFTDPGTTQTNTLAGTISGGTSIGTILTANPGTWTGSPTLTYQWMRNGISISGATSSTYNTTLADAGKVITFIEVATLSSLISTTPSSNSITPLTQSLPYIRGGFGISKVA